MAIAWRLILDTYPEVFGDMELNFSVAWSVSVLGVGILVGFRTNRGYARFWEGITLVQIMRAEWFEACSNLMAFTKPALQADPTNMHMRAKVVTAFFALRAGPGPALRSMLLCIMR